MRLVFATSRLGGVIEEQSAPLHFACCLLVHSGNRHRNRHPAGKFRSPLLLVYPEKRTSPNEYRGFGEKLRSKHSVILVFCLFTGKLDPCWVASSASLIPSPHPSEMILLSQQLSFRKGGARPGHARQNSRSPLMHQVVPNIDKLKNSKIRFVLHEHVVLIVVGCVILSWVSSYGAVSL